MHAHGSTAICVCVCACECVCFMFTHATRGMRRKDMRLQQFVLVRVYMCIIYACTHNAFLCRSMWVCTYVRTRQYCNLCTWVHVNVYVSCSRMPRGMKRKDMPATTISSVFEVYSPHISYTKWTWKHVSTMGRGSGGWGIKESLQLWWGRAHCFCGGVTCHVFKRLSNFEHMFATCLITCLHECPLKWQSYIVTLCLITCTQSTQSNYRRMQTWLKDRLDLITCAQSTQQMYVYVQMWGYVCVGVWVCMCGCEGVYVQMCVRM